MLRLLSMKPILFLAFFALAVALTGSTALAGNGGGQGLERAKEVQEAHSNSLIARADVVGTGVGIGADGQAVIVVYTLSATAPALPSRLDGVSVTARATGRIDARVDPKARFPRPVPIGVSTGHPLITAGTIGARVKDGSGNLYALSNNHVYANANAASIGDSTLQPGAYDGGTDPADKIGTLHDFQPISFKNGTTNVIDAAIASTTSNDLGTGTPSDGYGIPSSTTAAAFVGQAVQKYGRTTGQTYGTVSAINVIVDICYEARGPYRCKKNKLARFVDQIAIIDGNFSAGGDSGSSILTNNAAKNPVALLFAGGSTHTFANPIGPVLARFNVTIDDTLPGPVNDPPVATISSPADGSTHPSGATIQFTGSASDTEDGDVTASLVWTSDGGQVGTGGSFIAVLSDGNHAITATATDAGGKTGSDTVNITVGTVTQPTSVIVDSISYATEGGKSRDKHLLVTVALVDDLRRGG